MLVTKEQTTISGDLRFTRKVEMQFDPSARNMQVRNAIRMYANPRLAALREYTSNAKDAHQAAGYKGAVEVTLPTALHPFLTIVDHGIGLSADELEGFGQFGHTTKDGSNDYIGGFGLGSKSGLAVADQFTVISVKDGKKNVVVVGWDESGAPSLGFLDEQDTQEGNGTTIQIPSETGHGDWVNIAQGNTFLGWERGSIVVNGNEPKKSVHDTTQYKKIDGGWLTIQPRSGGGRYYYGPDTIDALVHGVYYSIQSSRFADRTHAKVLDGSVLEIANGSVDILPSRDDLEWTDRTIKAVRTVADKMVAAVVAEYEQSILDAKTFLDAKKIADAMDEIGLPVAGLTHKGILLDWTRETNHVITHGKVKSSASAKSGWQADRSATGTKSASEVHKVHTILVTGCDGETKAGYYRKDQKFLTQSSEVVPFLSAEADAKGVAIDKMNVYFTHEAKADLPKGFVASMDRVLDAKAFEAQAAERRKEWAKDRAASRKAGAAPKPVDRQLRVVQSYNNWAYSFTLRERSEQAIIADGTKVVVLHSEDALSRRVMEAHTGKYSSGAVGSLMKFLSQRSADTTFIMLAANHKASNLNITGWMNLSDWLKQELSTTQKLTPTQVSVRNYRRDRPHYDTITQIPAEVAATIKHKAMREWMTEYAVVPKETLVDSVSAQFPEYAPTQPEPSAFVPWERYPLVHRLNLSSDEGALLVEYVNMVDSTN